MKISTLLTIVAVLLATNAASPARSVKPAFFFVGAYSGARGIYGVSLNLKTGEMSDPVLMADVPGPSWLDLDGPRQRLFAIADAPNGAASGFGINPSRALTAINTAGAGGGGTTYITATDDGRAVLAANYNAGTVALMPVNPATGELKAATIVDQHTGKSVDPSRQTAPHPHAVQMDPSGKFALSCDLGNDKIYVYAVDSVAGKMTVKNTFAMPAGSGPRHLTFSSGGHFAYVMNELASTVTVLKWDAPAAKLTRVQTLNLLPAGFKAAHRGCEVVIHPSGKYLYAVDRGPDLITAFKIDSTTGKLTALGTTPTGGSEARHFAIDPSGRFLVLANMKSDKVVSFVIDSATGLLTAAGSIAITKPACILFLP